MNFLKSISPVNSFIFPAPSPATYTLKSLKSDLIFIRKSNNSKIPCLKFERDEKESDRKNCCILYFHGNGEDLGMLRNYLKEMNELWKCTLFAPEYPGYGICPGSPTENSIDEIAQITFEFIQRFMLANQIENLIIIGRSIGTGPAIRLAAKICQSKSISIKLAGLITISAFTSFKAVAMGVTSIGVMMANRWNSLEDSQYSIRHVTVPALFIHGEQDQLIPCEHSVKLANAKAKDFTGASVRLIHDAGHNDGLESVPAHVALFIASVVGVPKENVTNDNDDNDNNSVDADDDLMTSAALPVPVEKNKLLSEDIARQLMKQKLNNVDVVIVGGGPCGLFTALCLKCIRRSIRIGIVERHEVYVRSHVLRIDPDSLTHAPKQAGDVLRQLGRTVRTNAVEVALRSALEAFDDVAIVRGVRVTSFAQLLQCVSAPRFVVCADGARSVLRERAFAPNDVERTVLAHIVDFKYEATFAEPKNARKLHKLGELVPLLRLMTHIGEDFVGRTPTNGKYPVTVRFAVSAKEFEALRAAGASFRQPMELPRDEHLLPPPLARDLRLFLNMRSERVGERRESARVTAVELSVYRARHVVGRVQRRVPFALVGDAAFGVPYFRALNAGLICSAELAQRIDDTLNADVSSLTVGDIIEHTPQSSSSTTTTPNTSAVSFKNSNSSFFGAVTTSVKRNFLMSKASLTLMSNSTATTLTPAPARGLIIPNKAALQHYESFVTAQYKSEATRARRKRDTFVLAENNVLTNGIVVNLLTAAKAKRMAKIDPFHSEEKLN